MNISLIVQFSAGIGHLARVSALASELRKIAKVTLFSGGRNIGFPIEEQVQFVQLPAMYLDLENGAILKPVDPGMSAEECIAERSRILVESYKCNPPDILLTEYYPFTPGFFGESLDGLFNEIRNSNTRPLLFCSIRAFPKITYLDSDVAPEWIRSRLQQYFNGVLHHVDPAIFPLSSLGSYLNIALSGVPVYQTGFVRKQIIAPVKESCKGILLTVGGGNAKSAVLLKKWIEAVGYLSKDLYPVHAVCGPLMSPEDRASVRKAVTNGVILHERVTNMDSLIQECRAVVCMGGYNTLIEAMSLSKPVLSFASGTHEDQHFQIDRFSECGLLMKGDVNWSAHEIANAIKSLTDFSPRHKITTDGAIKTAQILSKLCLSSRDNLTIL